MAKVRVRYVFIIIIIISNDNKMNKRLDHQVILATMTTTAAALETMAAAMAIMISLEDLGRHDVIS